MKASILLLALLCAFPAARLFSQDAAFYPFVSDIDAEIAGRFVRISWEDSSDIKGPVYLYRSDAPFHAGAMLPEPIVIPYGVKSYVDEAGVSGIFHYFAAASDETGKRYTTALPFTNTLCVIMGENTYARGVENFEGGLKAVVTDGAVAVHFSETGENFVLYRSVRPIRRSEDLFWAAVASRGAFSPLIDMPVPGIPYYYALVPEAELGSASITITAGVNATLLPVEIYPGFALSPSVKRENRIRTVPLPSMTVYPSPNRPYSSLSPEAARAADAVGAKAAQNGESREPGIFLEDLMETSNGENAPLKEIVQGPFTDQNWEKAGEELRKFLSRPHSVPVECRSRFYLGEVYYFTGKTKEALFEFLAAQPYYPNESSPWIDAVLTRLGR